MALRDPGGHRVDLIDIAALGAVSQDIAPQRSITNGRWSNTQFTLDRATSVREWVLRLLDGYDVVNLHWTTFLLSAAEVAALAGLGTPVLVTMHDFNHVTGGCHYPAGCTGLYSGCHTCPQLDPEAWSATDVARVKWLKNLAARHRNVHLAAPSRYVLDAAAHASGVPPLRQHLLRNPYEPMRDVKPAGNPDRDLSVLLVADTLAERRKGAALAAESLQLFQAMSSHRDRLRIHVAGNADPALLRSLAATGADLRVHGRVTRHEVLASIYADSDVQLSTSHEDNWPNVLVEAGAYGCLAIVGPGHGCAEFAQQYPPCRTVRDYSPAAFAEALAELAGSDPEPLAAARAAFVDAVRRDHASARVAADYTAVLQQVASTRADPSAARPPVDTDADADPDDAAIALSSGFLGAATRLALATLPADRAGHLTVRLERPATSASALALHAVYEASGETRLVQVPWDGQASTLALRHDDAVLRHVFATEHSDYGMSALSFRHDAGGTGRG